MKRVTLLLLSFLTLRAEGLEWPSTVVELKPGEDQQIVTAVFPFRNTADKPVRIISVASIADPAKVTMRDAQCVNSVFEVELDPGAKPGDLRLRVRPADTARIAQATIRLSATVAGQSRVFVLYAAVR